MLTRRSRVLEVALELHLAHVHGNTGPRCLGGIHLGERLAAGAHVLGGVEELEHYRRFPESRRRASAAPWPARRAAALRPPRYERGGPSTRSAVTFQLLTARRTERVHIGRTGHGCRVLWKYRSRTSRRRRRRPTPPRLRPFPTPERLGRRGVRDGARPRGAGDADRPRSWADALSVPDPGAAKPMTPGD
jgi:hypothetical protein